MAFVTFEFFFLKNYRLSKIGYQLSATNYRLGIDYGLRIILYELSFMNYLLWIIGYELSVIDGPILVNDVQTRPSERAVFIFWSENLRNVLKRMKNSFSDFCDVNIWVAQSWPVC